MIGKSILPMGQSVYMKKLIRKNIIIFVLIGALNLLLQIGKEEKSYILRPVRFFGNALVISIFAGYAVNWVYDISIRKKD